MESNSHSFIRDVLIPAMSVANHDGSYGGSEGLYELAEINPAGHIVDESIKGYLTFAEVDCYLREISEY